MLIADCGDNTYLPHASQNMGGNVGQPGQSQRYSVSCSSKPSGVLTSVLIVTWGISLVSLVANKISRLSDISCKPRLPHFAATPCRLLLDSLGRDKPTAAERTLVLAIPASIFMCDRNRYEFRMV